MVKHLMKHNKGTFRNLAATLQHNHPTWPSAQLFSMILTKERNGKSILVFKERCADESPTTFHNDLHPHSSQSTTIPKWHVATKSMQFQSDFYWIIQFIDGNLKSTRPQYLLRDSCSSIPTVYLGYPTLALIICSKFR